MAKSYARIEDVGREMLAKDQDVEDKCLVVDEAAQLSMVAGDGYGSTAVAQGKRHGCVARVPLSRGRCQPLFTGGQDFHGGNGGGNMCLELWYNRQG